MNIVKYELAFLFTRAGVPNLSLTMYPFSISTDKHVPLQNFDR